LALNELLLKYDDLYSDAPNEIQQRKIKAEFNKKFCSSIPNGHVSGWIGKVVSVNDNGPGKAIELTLEVSTSDISASAPFSSMGILALSWVTAKSMGSTTP
jgi:hypothetical protein